MFVNAVNRFGGYNVAVVCMATEVVGEMLALKPIAMPRPRRIVPLPWSNGCCHCMRSASRSWP